METLTAAVLVVGNEVLSGKRADQNGPCAIRTLRDRGIRLDALLTLPDRLEIISEAVARERARDDRLFTAGGVGPTHDDVTLPAVAHALERPLVRHERPPQRVGDRRQGHVVVRGADPARGRRLPR